MPNGRPFAWHDSQREAIETLIFVWEFEKVRTRKALLERYAESLKDVRLAAYDEFAGTASKWQRVAARRR